MTREELTVRGNTVLAPKRTPYKKVEKKHISSNNKNKKNKNKFVIIRNIFLAFTIGLILVGRYCAIYNMQKQLNTTKSNITEMNKQNDNLKVELVKYNNLQYIEEVATTKLGMVAPNRNDAVYCNISRDKVITTANTQNSENTGNTTVGRITRVIQNIF